MVRPFLHKSNNFWCFFHVVQEISENKDERDGVRGQVNADTTFGDEVIELKIVVLRVGIAIALGNTIIVCIIDTLEELVEGDRLIAAIASEVLVSVSLRAIG